MSEPNSTQQPAKAKALRHQMDKMSRPRQDKALRPPETQTKKDSGGNDAA